MILSHNNSQKYFGIALDFKLPYKVDFKNKNVQLVQFTYKGQFTLAYKWVSVCLGTKRLWVRMPLQSL